MHTNYDIKLSAFNYFWLFRSAKKMSFSRQNGAEGRKNKSHLSSLFLFFSTYVGGTLDTTTCMSSWLTTETCKTAKKLQKTVKKIRAVRLWMSTSLNKNCVITYRTTHHYLSLAAVTLSIVVSSNHLKLEIWPPHVPVHDGRLHDATVRLDDEAILAVFGLFASRRGDDEAVHHGTVITGVLVQGLESRKTRRSLEMLTLIDMNITKILCLTSLAQKYSVLFLLSKTANQQLIPRLWPSL